MVIEEEEEEEANEEASNAIAIQTGLGVKIVETATTHDEPIQYGLRQQLSERSRGGRQRKRRRRNPAREQATQPQHK